MAAYAESRGVLGQRQLLRCRHLSQNQEVSQRKRNKLLAGTIDREQDVPVTAPFPASIGDEIANCAPAIFSWNGVAPCSDAVSSTFYPFRIALRRKRNVGVRRPRSCRPAPSGMNSNGRRDRPRPPRTWTSGCARPVCNPRNEEGIVRSVADYLERAAEFEALAAKTDVEVLRKRYGDSRVLSSAGKRAGMADRNGGSGKRAADRRSSLLTGAVAARHRRRA